MEFKFKYVNEEQLMKVIKKVQLERKCNRDAVDLVSLSSKEKYINVPKEEEYPQSLEEEMDMTKDYKNVGGSVNNVYLACSSDKSRPLSESLQYQAKEKHREKVNTLVIRLRNVRRNILTRLDELLVHNERINKSNNYFKDSNEKLDESVEDVKIKKCLSLIIKQEYPFVLSMRHLGFSAARQDTVPHLKALLNCHNFALRLLKIFICGGPYILKQDKIKVKLSDLLERMMGLSSVCKLFAIEHNDIVSSKDFLMDDVDRKCVSLLASGKKRIKLVPKCYEGKNVKSSGHTCAHCGANTLTSDAVQNNEMHIPMRKFKELADRVFGCKERSIYSRKKGKSHYKEHGIISIKNSKDKVNVLKEENNTGADKGAGELLNQLKHLVHDVNRPSSCGDKSLGDTVTGSESNHEVAKEETSNLIKDVNEDDQPKAKEPCEPLEHFDGTNNHLPGITENSLDNHQMKPNLQQNSVHSDGVGISRHLTSSSSMNDEQQQGISSFKDDLKFSHNIIKMSNTAGSISDKVIGECLKRISCEVDNFVEDFVQKMFSLEFT